MADIHDCTMSCQLVTLYTRISVQVTTCAIALFMTLCCVVGWDTAEMLVTKVVPLWFGAQEEWSFSGSIFKERWTQISIW